MRVIIIKTWPKIKKSNNRVMILFTYINIVVNNKIIIEECNK